MAAGDDEDPPHRKHRTDEEEREAHSEAGARGRKVNGVKALCAGFSYEQVPYWLSARVYLIHSMPDISALRDAPSPGQSRGPIGASNRVQEGPIQQCQLLPSHSTQRGS
jgi:hypothetical protein